MSEIILKATHQGDLHVGNVIIHCAVLENGTRLLTSKGLLTALKRPWKGKYRSTKLPTFLAGNNLIPFISNELQDVLTPIKYVNLRGMKVDGFKAEILPLVCEVYLNAKDENKLTSNQIPIAKQSEILIRSLSKVGIIALVDEVTGYQEIRDRIALQKILEKYLTDEWAKWTKTFPDEFYKELFKLKNIDYPPRTSQKPSYIGHWTNDIVYTRLAPGILKELKEKNPRLSSGQRKRKYHQYFTRDIGHPTLKEHLSNIIFMMKGCTTWNDFKRRLNRARPKYGDTILMDFEENNK